MKTAIELIDDERKRQINVEDWTAEHDDTHRMAELARAAACYALSGAGVVCPETITTLVKHQRGLVVIWPWETTDWKPSTNIRDLVKAGALIVAEIERLQRLEKKGIFNGNG